MTLLVKSIVSIVLAVLLLIIFFKWVSVRKNRHESAEAKKQSKRLGIISLVLLVGLITWGVIGTYKMVDHFIGMKEDFQENFTNVERAEYDGVIIEYDSEDVNPERAVKLAEVVSKKGYIDERPGAYKIKLDKDKSGDNYVVAIFLNEEGIWSGDTRDPYFREILRDSKYACGSNVILVVFGDTELGTSISVFE